jgi:hypothetical protein
MKMRNILKRKMFLFYFLSALTFTLFIPTAKAVDLEDIYINEDVVDVNPYSFNNQPITGRTFDNGKLVTETSGARFASKEPIYLGKTTITLSNDTIQERYMYKVPIEFDYNFFTALTKFDATPIREQERISILHTSITKLGYLQYQIQKSMGTVLLVAGGLALTGNFALSGITLGVAAVSQINVRTENYYANIPNYILYSDGANDSLTEYSMLKNSWKQPLLLKEWFADRYGYNGTLRFAVDLSPLLGSPSDMIQVGSDDQIISSNIKVSMGDANTKTNTTENQALVCGLLDTNTDIVINTNIKSDTSDNTNTTETVQSVNEDPLYDASAGIIYGGGISNISTSYTNEAWNIIPPSGGSNLAVYNANNIPIKNSSSLTFYNNSQRYFIDVPITKLQPELRIYETMYDINVHRVYFDDVLEYFGIWGSTGILDYSHYTQSISSITAWKVLNVFLHQTVQFNVWLSSEHIIKQTIGELGENNTLNLPQQFTGTDVWNNLITGMFDITVPGVTSDNTMQFIFLILGFLAIGLVIFILYKFGFLSIRNIIKRKNRKVDGNDETEKELIDLLKDKSQKLENEKLQIEIKYNSLEGKYNSLINTNNTRYDNTNAYLNRRN